MEWNDFPIEFFQDGSENTSIDKKKEQHDLAEDIKDVIRTGMELQVLKPQDMQYLLEPNRTLNEAKSRLAACNKRDLYPTHKEFELSMQIYEKFIEKKEEEDELFLFLG